MTLRDYIDSLTPDQLAAYAERCGTTVSYMKIKIKYARCEPRRRLRDALSEQSEGRVSDQEVLIHFGIIARTDEEIIDPGLAA